MKTIQTILLLLLLIFYGCNKNETPPKNQPQNITIFFVNDTHGQIDNFSKVKYIVDQEKEINDVLVISTGDMFSGNPVVDNYSQKGYPMIHLMNQVGFDIMTLGNHEFDYGPEMLKERINQSNFPWICANTTAKSGEFAQPEPYKSIDVGKLKIVFLGLLETMGSDYSTIPSSHPWRVQNYEFTDALEIAKNYSMLKEQENADLFIALSHLGENMDYQLAANNSFFDVIIGGHSHTLVNTVNNGIPIFQAGGDLNYLGKIELTVADKEVENFNYTLIDLEQFENKDAQIQAIIDDYNDWPELYEEIGHSPAYHSKTATGCFYTDAIKTYLDVDVSFQNTGGVRAALYEGPITRRDIYEISPFNNGTVIYEMSVEEIKYFLKESGSGFYYSGILIDKIDGEVVIFNQSGNRLRDNVMLRVGINDYIPAVHSPLFPEEREEQALTAAETIIKFVEDTSTEIDYSACSRYFRF